MNYWDLMPAEIIVQISDTLQDQDFKSLNQTYRWMRETLRDRTKLRSRSILESSRHGLLPEIIFRCGLFNLKPLGPVTRKKINFVFPLIDSWLTFTYDAAETENFPAGLYMQCLMIACEHGHLNVVKYFIGRRFLDPRAMENRAVKLAISNGHVNVAAYLLGLSEVSSLLDRDSILNLEQASGKGHVEIIRYITEHCNISKEQWRAGFLAACLYGQVNVAMFLCTKVTSKDYRLGLERAIGNDRTHVVLALLPKVSNATVINEVFVKSCLHGRLNIIQVLLSNSKIRSIIDPDYKGNRALMYLVMANSDYVSVLEYLIQMDFMKSCLDPTAVYNNLFVEASKNGSISCVALLLRSVPEVKADCLHNHALLQATRFGQFEVVKFLLTGNNNGPFHGVERSLNRAMKWAVKCHCGLQTFQIIEMLSKYPDAEAVSDVNLLKSVEHGNTYLVQFLIQLREKKAQSESEEGIRKSVIVSETLLTSLFKISSESGYYQIYKILMSIPSKNDHELAFESACFCGHMELMKIIVEERIQKKKKWVWAVDVSMKNNLCLIQALNAEHVFYYLANLQNLDGSDRVDFARDNHGLLTTAFSGGNIKIVRFILGKRSMRNHRRDFIVKFISKALAIFSQFPLGSDQSRNPVCSYILPLRERYIGHSQLSRAGSTAEIVSEAWEFLGQFRQQLRSDYIFHKNK